MAFAAGLAWRVALQPGSPMPTSPAKGEQTPANQPAGESPRDAAARPTPPDTSPARSPTSREEPKEQFLKLSPIRPLEELLAGLRSIDAEADAISADSPVHEAMAAMIRLRMYRFLCGVAEKEITLDEQFNVEALAAAEICRQLGRLSHDPENPGMPADQYALARRGAGSGNLAYGMNSLPKAVDAWMDDSDADNIEVLGHRRWCLNPPLRRVGFGRTAGWCAMWAHDRSGTTPCESPAICFPPPGPVPIDLFRPHYAWSVALNPRFFRQPKAGEIKVTICPSTGRSGTGKPLPLEHFGVDTKGCGISNCIVFRSPEVSTAVCNRYLVTITGPVNHDKAQVTITYEVEFVER